MKTLYPPHSLTWLCCLFLCYQPLALFSQNPVPKSFQRSWNRHQIQAEVILQDSQVLHGNILTTHPEELMLWTGHRPPAWEWRADSVVRINVEDIHQLKLQRKPRWMQSALELGGATTAATNLQLWRWLSAEPYYDASGSGPVIGLAGLTSLPFFAMRTRMNHDLVFAGRKNVWVAAQPLLQQAAIQSAVPRRFRVKTQDKTLPPVRQGSGPSKPHSNSPPLQVSDFRPARWHIGYYQMFTEAELQGIFINYFDAYSTFGYFYPQDYFGNGLEVGYQFRPRWRVEGAFFRMEEASLGGPNDALYFSGWWDEPQAATLLSWQASLRIHSGYLGLSWLPRGRFMSQPYRWEPFLSFGATIGAPVFQTATQGELITEDLERFPLEPTDQREVLWALGGYFRMGTDFYLNRWVSLCVAIRISNGQKSEFPNLHLNAIGTDEAGRVAAHLEQLFPAQLEAGLILHL